MCVRTHVRITGMLRAYRAVVALNLTTSSAGTHPRSFTSMPCALGPLADLGAAHPIRLRPASATGRPPGTAPAHRAADLRPQHQRRLYKAALPYHRSVSGTGQVNPGPRYPATRDPYSPIPRDPRLTPVPRFAVLVPSHPVRPECTEHVPSESYARNYGEC
jgi:hypothetical protein